ncbi:MAG: ABC transporter substrate-binding protein [Acidisphaera sp.]|nr:ABC transporter substrate-binding protein [Acidisphaera sp.]
MTGLHQLDRRGFILAAGAGALALGRPARAAVPDVINIAFFVETKPTMIAKGNGWFQDEAKAKLNWTEVGSGAEINTAIAAGSVDIGIGIGSSPTAAGLSQGIPYKLIGMLDNIGPAEEMTVRKAANIKSPADFKGKKVATPFGSTSHFRLLGFLQTNHLTQADVTVLDMRPDAIVAAWSRGDIDAAYVWSPAKSKLLAAGGAVYETYKELDAAGYVIADLIVARTAFLQQYPAAVTGILSAYGRALDLWKTQPAEAAKIVGQQAGVSAQVAQSDMEEYDFVPLKTQLSDQWLGEPGKGGKFDEVLKRTADFLVEQKSIRSAPGPDVFVKGTDTSALARAAG